MRPPRSQRSSLRYPLDVLLGSVGNVRLVRVLLHDVGEPVGVPEAAKMAGLSPAGARKALEGLVQAGLVARVGTGRARKYGISDGSAFKGGLVRLFAEEQRRFDDLIKLLRGALEMAEVHAAWLDGLPMGDGEPLQISVVVDTKAISWMGQELRMRLAEGEKAFNLIMEIDVYTRADGVEPGEHAVLLWSTGTEGKRRRGPGRQGREESARRSLKTAGAIADLISRDSSLVRRAWQHTNRLLHEGQGTASGDINEWRHLLETYSVERIRDLLVSMSSRAERLRRSSPFFAVLTAEERDRVAEALEKKR